MARPIHMMIRVRDEQRSVDFYRTAFEMTIAQRIEFDNFTLVYLRGEDDPFELELTVNHDQDEPYELGNGYGHVALSVDDLESEYVRMRDAGLSPDDMKTLEADGFTARYFFLSDPDGYRIEVVQRGSRFL